MVGEMGRARGGIGSGSGESMRMVLVDGEKGFWAWPIEAGSLISIVSWAVASSTKVAVLAGMFFFGSVVLGFPGVPDFLGEGFGVVGGERVLDEIVVEVVGYGGPRVEVVDGDECPSVIESQFVSWKWELEG